MAKAGRHAGEDLPVDTAPGAEIEETGDAAHRLNTSPPAAAGVRRSRCETPVAQERALARDALGLARRDRAAQLREVAKAFAHRVTIAHEVDEAGDLVDSCGPQIVDERSTARWRSHESSPFEV